MEQEFQDVVDDIKNLDLNLSKVNKRKQSHFHTIDCPICQSKFKSGQEYAEAKCGHYFHVPCLGKWLSQNDTCPTCRSFLDSSKYLDERKKEEVISSTSIRQELETNKDLVKYFLNNGGNKSSKLQLITILKLEGNFYLPPSRNITAEYLKLVFGGQKKILKINQVNFVKDFF